MRPVTPGCRTDPVLRLLRLFVATVWVNSFSSAEIDAGRGQAGLAISCVPHTMRQLVTDLEPAGFGQSSVLLARQGPQHRAWFNRLCNPLIIFNRGRNSMSRRIERLELTRRLVRSYSDSWCHSTLWSRSCRNCQNWSPS